MIISAKGRYALMLMTELGRSRFKPLSVSELSKRQGISPKYAEQIMAILKRAGYVESSRGAMGGYKLAMSPQQCRVGDILRLMEGTPEIPNDDALKKLWEKMLKAVDGVINSYTVADIMSETI